MNRHAAFFLAALSTSTSALLSGCGADPSGSPTTDDGETGSIGVALSVPGGSILGTVTYTVTSPGGFSRSGNLDFTHSSTISGLVSLPAGGPYTLTLTGTTTDGSLSCTGTATFSIQARQTTPITVKLTCKETPKTGSVLVNGTLNVCPVIDGISTLPAEAVVGSSVALTASAHDTDAAPSALTYAWTASSGTLSSASAKAPTFTCTAPGPATITLAVSDGDPAAGCVDTQTATVNCTKNTAVFAVFGDWPYGNIIAKAASFIAQVNADPDVDLALHVGDIHSGSQACDGTYNASIYNYFQSFTDPVVYTPGDNEWTDCQKTKEFSSGAPLQELTKIRTLFFPNAGRTIGGVQKLVSSQANEFDAVHPEDAEYVENVMWEQAGALIVTLNVPGSNDDTLPWAAPFSDPTAQANEVAKRNAANGRWLARAFARATANGDAGVLIGLQADLWDPAAFATGGDGLNAYDALVQQIGTLSVAFGKPVLLVNGDSHLYESDTPLADPASSTGVMHPVGFPVPNLKRITVDGSTNFADWVKLTIDPTTPAVFSWVRVNTP